MKGFIFLFLFTAFVSGCHFGKVPAEKIFTATRSEFKALRLFYYSDYFSFVGGDEQGKVAFALDNNRGQDGDTFQAEHFVCLHDEQKGWIKMKGSGLHPNPKKELERIPDTEFFHFIGTPETGIKIRSEINKVELTISPLPKVLIHQKGLALYWLGSSPAIFKWDGRRIQGRVIYEYLFLVLLPNKDKTGYPQSVFDKMARKVTLTGKGVTVGGSQFLTIDSIK